jgi:hypothetical protein
VVEQEIQMCKRRGSSTSASGLIDGTDAPLVHDLALCEVIGAGGYGMVWRGTWKKVTAAVKVRRRWGSSGPD